MFFFENLADLVILINVLVLVNLAILVNIVTPEILAFDSGDSDVPVNQGILANMVALLILLILLNLGILTNLVILVQNINMVNLAIVFTLGILVSDDFGESCDFGSILFLVNLVNLVI